jgi:DNA-binding NarL/FixJ family response regulator
MVTRTAGVLRSATEGEALPRPYPIAAHAAADSAASHADPPIDKTAAIVVIHRQPLFRECLVRCLEHVHQSCSVLAFSNLSEWLSAGGRNPAPAAIVACVSGKGSIDPELRRELAQLSAKKIDLPALIISDAQDLETVAAQVQRAVQRFFFVRSRVSAAISLTRRADNLAASTPEGRGNGDKLPENSALNARQLAILEALSQGKDTKQIAGELHVRHCTVRVHVRSIMKRLNARTQSEIVAVAGQLLGAATGIRHEEESSDRLSPRDRREQSMLEHHNRLRVVVIDHQRLRQAGLVRLLEEWADSKGLSVATITAPKELDLGPNCAIVVLNVGGDSVTEQESHVWIRRVRTAVPDVPLVILSDREERREILAAFEQGAKGFIATSLDPSLALDALTFLLQGGSFFPLSALLDQSRTAPAVPENEQSSEQVAPTLSPELNMEPERPSNMASGSADGVRPLLTPRQSEVLQRLREGKPNKVIARELNMTEATVKVHVRQIMRKFGATNRTQAVLCAARMSSGDSEN